MDAGYKTYSWIFQSKGITAREVDDTIAQGSYLALTNCEELAENAVAARLGSQIINRTGTAINALSGLVHSVTKLAGLNATAWRYAGSGTNLYRRAGLTQGPYTAISGSLSGQPWQGVVYRPDLSSMPYLFIADAAGMIKDNGTLVSPQNMGILQPQYPVQAQAQNPDLIILDNYNGSIGDYVFSGTSGSFGTYVSTTLTSAVTAPGIQAVTVADETQPGLFQTLTIDSGGNQETVLVIQVTADGFIANFTKTHTIGTGVTSADLTAAVAASTTATISKSFGGTPITAWPTTLQQADYIGLYLFVGNPSNIQSITLKFDCGDGSFDTDYFYKVIGQGPLQSLLDSVNDPTTSATDAILSESLNLYGPAAGNIAALNTGLNQWTPLLIQLSDFAGSGRADFNDPVFNWNAVNGYQVEIVTNDSGSSTVQLAALVLFGGAGPDSFAGVAYDWMFTFYNPVDGTESNPSVAMTNLNPPLDTNWILPRRQPVLLTLIHPTVDPQVTMLRVYRRGGTLGDNYRRLNTISLGEGQTQYLDLASDADIQDADFISFVNDVPVTSGLPNPVNTTLAAAVTTTNQVTSVFPQSMANISVSQQVLLGIIDPDALLDNTEIVIVLQVFSDHFTAFVQNTHGIGETVSATAKYAQPVTIMAEAFNQMWFAGDPNNPHFLYWSAKSNPQAVSSAAYVEVGTPDDPITAIVPFKGNLYVSTRKFWWSVAPGSNQSPQATVYPTAAKHGCVAPLGYVATEEAIYYQAIDGLRAFAGGASSYLTQNIEFIFQDVGTTPIVEADQSQLAQTRTAYWNNMVFFSYIGVDGHRHRVIMHTVYKRWRNDEIDAESIFLEADTNTLVFGDANGLVHIDRVGSYDEANNAGTLQLAPITIDLQLPYLNQGAPELQKSYNELVMDVDTQGQDLTMTLLFNDGEFSLGLGTVNTANRQRVNIPINAGDGEQAYKVALQLTGSFVARAYVYQAAINAIMLAKTRKTFDSYWLRLGTDESKLVKQLYIEYMAGAAITFYVFYDGLDTAGYTFIIPAFGGVRNAIRVRLPAVKCRLIRIIGVTSADCQLWDDSKLEWKNICSGKGYSVEVFST